MNILHKNEVVKSVCEKMGTEIEMLIKQSMKIIQSLLILVPPLVVDCFPNPDICSGAYGKNVVSFNAADYVTTRSALFFSYQGESVAKDGECLSIASITEHPELLRFHDTVNINLHTLLFEVKLLESNMEGNGIPEGKCSSEVDEKHGDGQENESTSLEMFSGGLIPKKHRNTAISQIQNVTDYTCHKGTQTDETLTSSRFQGTNTVPQHLIRSRSMSPVRWGKYYNDDHRVTDGTNLTIAAEKTKDLTVSKMPPKIGRELEHDKQYHTTLCKMSQTLQLLPDKCAIHENRKSFQQTDHAHITTDTLYQEQSPSTTVDIYHEPNAVGDKKLVEVCKQSDTREDNSEEQSDPKKDNSEEQSDPKKDNSEDNSEEQSDPREDNSKQSDPEKDNSKEQSDQSFFSRCTLS